MWSGIRYLLLIYLLPVSLLEQPTMAGYDVTEGREVLGEYVKRIKLELSQHYDEVSAMVY